MPAPRLGIALGSGGARGLAHCGVLEALHAAGLKPDVVAGTSMGALVGALYARDADPAATWESLRAYRDDNEVAEQWAAFVPRREGESGGDARPWHSLFDFMQRGRIAVKTMTARSIEDAERLRGPLRRLFDGTRSFGDLALPLATVALDLVDGEMVVFKDGDLLDGLYASCAIPGVFPPLERHGRIIVDGGGPFRVPVEACRELGADFVIAVDIPGYHETNLHNGFNLGLRSNTIARDRLNEFVCATADALVRPDLRHVHWADFGAADEVRRLGREAAEAAMPEIDQRWRRKQSPVLQIIDRVGRVLGGAA
ncbi:MAG: patatin-like phospholipase family protein [Candidatus Krumholzibacteriia bacterium]